MRCVIIGAGPAGLSAGIQLLLETKTIECIIIEKNPSPQKPCGGLITPKSKELLSQLGISLGFLKKCKKISVSYKNVNFDYTTSEHFYTCQRDELIQELIKRFIALGGQIVFDKFEINDYEREQVICQKQAYKYDYLILANGYSKKFSDISNKPVFPKKYSFGVNSVITNKNNSISNQKIQIIFLKELEGYCWCFPLPNRKMNIGFAGKLKRYPHSDYLFIKQKLDEHLGIDITNYKGRFLPIDEFRHIRKHFDDPNNIYRIGEAGGYFDSLTGEGIYFALFTGILASKHISKIISSQDFQNATKIVSKICNGSTFTRKLLFRKWIIIPLLLHLAKHTPKLDIHLTDKLILKYQYNYYSAFLSPLFCYTNRCSPYNIQNTLDDYINTNKEDKMAQKKLNEQYELNRENTLVSQAGLITAVFSFSTTALFTVWELVLSELEQIPDYLVHLAIGTITFFLLLSMLFAVMALCKLINTNKKTKLTVEYIKKNNNKMVNCIKISILFFLIALMLVFLSAIAVGAYYYIPVLIKKFSVL